MLKVPAYNSKKESFHHTNSKCGLGVRIPPHNRVSGTSNKPLCKNCEKLNDREVVNRTPLLIARAVRSRVRSSPTAIPDRLLSARRPS
jgi:hypothetical protein